MFLGVELGDHLLLVGLGLPVLGMGLCQLQANVGCSHRGS